MHTFFPKMFRPSIRLIPWPSKWLMAELRGKDICAFSCKHFVTAESNELRVKPFLKVKCFDICPRSYAKSRDKNKDRRRVTRVEENELRQYLDVSKLMADLEKPLETFKEELVRHATPRSSAGAIESMRIHMDGSMYTVRDLAQIGKKSQKLIVLDFASFPKAIPIVAQSLQNSELNINAQQEGTKLIVPIPKVTRKHREVLAKKCKLYYVKCKDEIRDIQMKYTRNLGNIEKLSSEDKFRISDHLNNLGNKQILMAEEIMKGKQNEILKVDDET